MWERIKRELRNKEQLYPVAYSRYVYALIGAAAQKQWREESNAASKRLRREFHTKEIASCVSTKTRLMAFGTGFMPHLYRLVRRIYDQITGVSKKYDV